MVLLESRFTLSVVTSCQFLSLFLYISSFLVFFFFLLFFFPLSRRERRAGVSQVCACYRVAQSCSNPPSASLTHVSFRRCYQKCVSAFVRWSKICSGVGGLPQGCRRRRGDEVERERSDQRPTRTSERKPAVVSAGLRPSKWPDGPGFSEKRMRCVYSRHTPELGVRVCVIVIIRDWALHHEKVPTDKNHQSVFQSF